jgi:hypothetical protein
VSIVKVEDYYENIVNTLERLGIPEEDINIEEIMQFITSNDISKKMDYEKYIKTYLYAYNRLVLKKSYVESFKIAFPERSVKTSNNGRFKSEGELGSPLSESSLLIKAKNLEKSTPYKSLIGILSTSLYVSFAVERFEVIEKAYKKSLDDSVSDRDRPAYMKIFLEETRKEEGKGLSINVNSNNQVNNVNNPTIIDSNDIMERLGSMAKEIKNISSSDLKGLLAKTKEQPDAIDAELVDKLKKEL